MCDQFSFDGEKYRLDHIITFDLIYICLFKYSHREDKCL